MKNEHANHRCEAVAMAHQEKEIEAAISEQDLPELVMRLARLTRRAAHSDGRYTHSFARLLHNIAENDGASSGEIAELLDVRPSTLSEALDHLEKNNLVERRRDANDSRVIRLHLTEQGQQRIKLGSEALQAFHDAYGSCFSAEEKSLFIELCSKLCNHLSEQCSERTRRGRRHQHCRQ